MGLFDEQVKNLQDEKNLIDNRQHRNVEVDALALSDSAIETLKSKKLNNRLVSELLS